MRIKPVTDLPGASALDPRRHALFLDIDGTLAPIADNPSTVRLTAETRATLDRVERAFGGAMAFLTGRTINDADAILGRRHPSIAGVHGAQMRVGGQDHAAAQRALHVARARDAIRARFAFAAIAPRVEDKGISFALHYRHAPELRDTLLSLAQQVATTHDLRIVEGKMVIELVAGAQSKADALRAFMQRPPFMGRIPLAVGDDLTDEDAFLAARALGGEGVLVGSPRTTAAGARLDDCAAVVAWLSTALGRHA